MKIKYPTFDIVDNDSIKDELDKITDISYSEGSTSHTLKEIKNTLLKGLMSKYGFDKDKAKEVCEGLLSIQGISDKYFDTLNRFYKMLEAKHQADLSIDANANKEELSIKGALKEIELSLDKLIGFDILYRICVDLYGKQEAKRLTLEMYDYSLGLSDASDIMIPYCWALDSTKLVIKGANFGQLSTKPTHKVRSYISALCEIVHQMSNHQAGALALGTLFLDIAHIMLYYERVPLSQLKNDKVKRKEIENCFQQLVHSVNFLSRSAVQSPFTNVSIFDKGKLLSLISEDNYGWYFPYKKEVLQDNYINEDTFNEEEYKNFVIKYIFELQKIYVDFFTAGDPSHNGMQYRFPVTTINLSKVWNEKEQCFTIEDDNELLNYIIHKDIPRYNIFCSEGTKVASCCLSGDELIEVYNEDDVKTISDIRSFVNLYLKDGQNEAKIDDNIYIMSMNKDGDLEKVKITGVLKKKNNISQLVHIKVNNRTISVTPDHMFKVKDKESGNLLDVSALEISRNKDRYLLPVTD